MFSNFDFDVIVRSLPYLFLDGMTFTLTLTALATTGGVIFGTLLAMMRLSGFPLLSVPAAGYVNLMRSVPLLLVIFWFYSRCSKPRISARSCGPASSRSRAARWRRRRRSA